MPAANEEMKVRGKLKNPDEVTIAMLRTYGLRANPKPSRAEDSIDSNISFAAS